MSLCMKCSAELAPDEIGLHKKFINRGSTEFMCKKCLGKYLNVTTEFLDERVIYFKKSGCLLFPPLEDGEK